MVARPQQSFQKKVLPGTSPKDLGRDATHHHLDLKTKPSSAAFMIDSLLCVQEKLPIAESNVDMTRNGMPA
jgi:hypothetical protein